jgi:hypothetical protein
MKKLNFEQAPKGLNLNRRKSVIIKNPEGVQQKVE